MPIAVNTPKRASNPPSMDDLEFLRCPSCGGKTRDKIRTDTELKNFWLSHKFYGITDSQRTQFGCSRIA